MSAETLPKSTTEFKNENVPTTSEMEIIVHGPPSQEIAVDAPSSREIIIPVETRMSKAKRRLADFLNDRVIEPLHNQADQADDEASRTKYSDDHEDALKMNTRYDRNQKVKETFTKIGASSLNFLKTAGLITLGAGLIGAEKVSQGVTTATKATGNIISDTYSSAKDTSLRGLDTAYFATKDAYIGARDKAVERKATRLNEREQIAAVDSAAKERAGAMRELVFEEARKQAIVTGRAANVRKLARHEAFTNKVTSGKETLSNLWQRAQDKRRVIGGHAIRTAKRARAVSYKAAASAHAAGYAATEAAKDTWQDSRSL